MPTQVFDDGTTLDTNGTGRVTSVTDNTGAVSIPSSSILGNFADLLTYGARGAIDAKLHPAPAPVPSTLAPAGLLSSRNVGILVLAVGAFFLLKHFSK